MTGKSQASKGDNSDEESLPEKRHVTKYNKKIVLPDN